MTDVIIIGAGVSGACIARELSRQDRSILVLEKAADVCEGTSKANSGIVHGGYDAKPGTLKAKLNLEGSLMMEALSKELDFPYKRNGAMVLAGKDDDKERLCELLERGRTNGVEGLGIIDREEILRLEPGISDDIEAALYVPSSAVTDPFLLTVSMAENAASNGVSFRFENEVTDIEKTESGYLVKAREKGLKEVSYECRHVINAAGVYADKIHGMVSKTPMKITAVRGEYCLFDKEAGDLITHTLFRLPTKKGKGVLLTPTVHGNLMAGPTADAVDDKEAVNTTSKGLSAVLTLGAQSVSGFPAKKVITSFAGLRAHEEKGDFIIKEAEDAKGFIDVAGIESPGLSAAPAIGVYVAKLLMDLDPVSLKRDFISSRRGIPSVALSTDEERQKLIEEDPAFANVICRCELITEGEIVRAIKRIPGATTLDGIKRRVRAGMGRCQGGFCSPKVLEILSRELQEDPFAIRKSNGESEILLYENRHPDNTKERE